jgi:hypothetical protein
MPGRLHMRQQCLAQRKSGVIGSKIDGHGITLFNGYCLYVTYTGSRSKQMFKKPYFSAYFLSTTSEKLTSIFSEVAKTGFREKRKR